MKTSSNSAAKGAAGSGRDVRPTTVLDTITRDAVYAWRSLRKAPLVAFTIVTTVGLGLGLVAAVFTIMSSMVFRADEVREPQELFAVTRPAPADAAPQTFTRAEYDALLRETDVFANAFAMGPEIARWIDGQRLEGGFVTGNFFQALGVSALRGRTFTPADDVPGERVIVLSHRAWMRYFAGDLGVLSRTVSMNGVPFQVVGVMPEKFRGLTIAAPDFWVPLALLGEIRPSAGGDEGAVDVVGRLAPGLAPGEATARLVAWDLRRSAAVSAERPAQNLTLEPRQGKLPLSPEVMALFMPIFFAFGLILMIGCANVANLLLARAIVRQREIGIRLAVGASAFRITRQLLTESLLLALVSAAVGFGISRLVLMAVVRYITSAWTNLGDIRLAVPPADWRVALFLVIAAVVSTLFFALAPALRSARFDLVRAMNGEVTSNARPGRTRNALVTLQVTGSVLLLVLSAIFLRSSWLAATVDPGLRIADTVFVNVANEAIRGGTLDAVSRDPNVAALAASSPGAFNAIAEGATGASTVTYRLVSAEYFDVLGIDFVRGRGFEQAERSTAAAVAVLSAAAAQELWPGRDPVGQVLTLERDPNAVGPAGMPPPTRTAVVVGVARDVTGFRIGGQRLLQGPDVYLPTVPEATGTSLVLRMRGDADAASRGLIERLSVLDEDVGEIIPLRRLASMEANILAIPFWLTLALGSLALFLTLSGLFSVLSYLVEQRTREIGVRIALGATRQRIGALVLLQSARPVGVGLLVGAALPASLGAVLLATPAAALIGDTVRLFDPIAYAASLLCVVAACAAAALVPVLRAGRVNPLAALRQD